MSVSVLNISNNELTLKPDQKILLNEYNNIFF